MCGWSFTIITIILSSIILLVLKDLLANFIITCTLKEMNCMVVSRRRSPRKSP
jgi:hypothetical protein